MLEFLDGIYHTKTRGMGLPYDENLIVLTLTVFGWPTIWQTDRQMAIAYIALSICDMLSCANQECPAVADKLAHRETMPKIPPVRS